MKSNGNAGRTPAGKRGRPSTLVLPVHGYTHQRVADESDHEDHGVHEYENPFGFLRRDVFDQKVLVLLVGQVGHVVVLGEVGQRRVARGRFSLARRGVHRVPADDVRHDERDDHGQRPFRRRLRRRGLRHQKNNGLITTANRINWILKKKKKNTPVRVPFAEIREPKRYIVRIILALYIYIYVYTSWNFCKYLLL